MKIKQFLLGLVAASCLAMPAFAAPIPFQINTITLTPGSGYGPGNGNQEQLDVVFQAFAAPAAFGLNVGQSFTFNVARVILGEACINPSTCPASGNGPNNETDGLNLGVKFNFTNPFSGIQDLLMIGTAYPGLVNDADEDYKLVFAPKEVTFGNGGRFSLDLLDLSFTNVGTQNLTATLTLLNAPASEGGNNEVPEPASLALIGLGLAGLRIGVKRRKA